MPIPNCNISSIEKELSLNQNEIYMTNFTSLSPIKENLIPKDCHSIQKEFVFVILL